MQLKEILMSSPELGVAGLHLTRSSTMAHDAGTGIRVGNTTSNLAATKEYDSNHSGSPWMPLSLSAYILDTAWLRWFSLPPGLSQQLGSAVRGKLVPGC